MTIKPGDIIYPSHYKNTDFSANDLSVFLYLGTTKRYVHDFFPAHSRSSPYLEPLYTRTEHVMLAISSQNHNFNYYYVEDFSGENDKYDDALYTRSFLTLSKAPLEQLSHLQRVIRNGQLSLPDSYTDILQMFSRMNEHAPAGFSFSEITSRLDDNNIPLYFFDAVLADDIDHIEECYHPRTSSMPIDKEGHVPLDALFSVFDDAVTAYDRMVDISMIKNGVHDMPNYFGHDGSRADEVLLHMRQTFVDRLSFLTRPPYSSFVLPSINPPSTQL